MTHEWDGRGKSPWLYAKSAGGAINVWRCWTEAHEVVVEWGQEHGAMQTARFECEGKNAGKKNETSSAEQAVKEAIAKFKKQRKKKYFLSSEEASTTLNIKPMLAKSFKDRRGKVTYPAYIQPKFDGVRCFAYRPNGHKSSVILQSRGGDPYDVEHIREELEAVLRGDTVLDGELYIHGTSLQNITSLVKRPQPGSIKLQFHVYDVTSLKSGGAQRLPWHQREQLLRDWFHYHNRLFYCHYVRSWIVDNEQQVKEHHDRFVQGGYEGAIIRAQDGVYKFGHRSSDLLKYKDFQDAEFPIVSFTTGKGKFANVPIFRCTTGEGREFDVAPKGTDAERAEMLRNAHRLIGAQLTVRFFDWTDDRVPHFPVGVCIREPGT